MKKTHPVETARQVLLALPGVEEGTSFGTLAFRVRKKLLARLLEDNETLALKCDDRDLWLTTDPQAFYVTKHYLNYPFVLVRLPQIKRTTLRDVIEQAWRQEAGARLIKQHESGSYTPPPVVPLAAPPPKVSDEVHRARARRLCLALPEVEEKEAWGSPTFRVKGKMFAMYLNNHHGDGRIALWLKAPPGVQELLVEAAPEKFFKPPYQGVFGWIGLHVDHCEDNEIASHVRAAYRMVAPKKLQELV
ncbi:MAG TPA: MmcQ/YjbR family DNA-binding protein [Blastocatellia bacterium]|nr:MmcQ/YjbR family DNA-binding protein [Blastocatellia bacterium]